MEALEEEELKVSSPKTPYNGKSARGFWGNNTKRRKLWETRKESVVRRAGTIGPPVLREPRVGISGTLRP